MKLSAYRELALSVLAIAPLVLVLSCGSNASDNPPDAGRKAPCSYIPKQKPKPFVPDYSTPKGALAALTHALAKMDLAALEACYTPERWQIDGPKRKRDFEKMSERNVTSVVLKYQESDMREDPAGEYYSIWVKLTFETDTGTLTRESGDVWVEEELFILKKVESSWRFTK